MFYMGQHQSPERVELLVYGKHLLIYDFAGNFNALVSTSIIYFEKRW